MLRNYLVIAIRNLFRQKAYSVINILGLAIGLMACLFIVLFIYDEFKYDRHHSKGKDIYRFIVEYKDQNGNLFPIPIQAYRLKDALETEFPEMEKITRVTMPYPAAFEYQEKQIRIEISAVDDDFFDIFDIEMLAGDPKTALNGPDNILLSESHAQRLFGDEDPMGKVVDMYTNVGTFPVKISGIYRDFPRTSHIHLDGIFSTRITDNIFNERQLKNWGEGSNYVYAYIPSHVDKESIESRFPDFVEKARGEGASESVDYSLQPLFDIHLKSHYRYEAEANGDIRYVYIFGLVALFILLIAAFNYMNLSTARSIRRSKEVGVRKVTGASKMQLVGQFLGEAVVFTFIAMWIAVLMAELFLPYFNNLSGKELEISIFNDWKLLGLLLLASLLIGVFAGIYPAFFLSRFKPVNALYGESGDIKVSNVLLRKSLVVLQFSISIVLIISTLVIFNQWNHMRNAKLGINPENVIVIPKPSDDFRTFKQEILKNPKVISASALNKKPTRELSSNLSFRAEGMDDNSDASIKIVTVDWDFFKTIGNEIIEGRAFTREFGSDERDAFIVNEAAVDYIGWDEPIGKWFETWTLDSAGVNWVERKGNIVGVAENFYFESLHNEIKPVVYYIQNNWINWMVVRISSTDMQETLSFIGETWSLFNTEEDFYYSFYEEDIQNLYLNESRIFRIFISFAILAIFIASLGILGLVSFTAEQRTKEIGIRKTMGASVTNVIRLLTFDFLKLVLLANLIAWPVAWYFMSRWLQDFPIRVDLGIWVFLLSAFLAVLIALLTTLFQAWRAASTNPAVALKYE
jgi:putative ABC transport system permease protein